ncbi:MAG: HEAT repeat domain-containing protein [Promethearchaeota archaeon]
MSKELKDLIDSVDSANQAQTDLETTVRELQEEVKKLNFTIGEQRTIIQTQESMLSNFPNGNIPEDVSVLKELVTQQRQDIIKQDKDVEILQQTISEITVELENVQKYEGENEELIYANKEIVQLTEENENFRLKVNLQKEPVNFEDDTNEEGSDLLEAKKLIIQLTEENGINRVQIANIQQELENLSKQKQENEALKNQFSHELTGANKIIDQITYDNDQYHAKVNYIQQKLEDTIKFQAELPKIDEDNRELEELNKILFELEMENNNLKQRINKRTLKLQKFESANTQLSDLIIDLKVQQDDKGKSIEFESSPKRAVYDDLPPNLFFQMYRFLSEDDKTTIVNQLINDLNSHIRDLRTYAIKILSVIKGERIFNVLKEIINDDDWIVKLYLIKALRHFKKDETIPILKKMLEDKDTDVREAALSMLSDLKQS